MVSNVWPQAIVQTCIIHLIRNTFRLTSRKYWDEIKHDIRPIYAAINATAARVAFHDLAEKWGPPPGCDPARGQRLGRVHPFLDYDVEIRRVICSTNAIESLNARYRRAIKARGHFPNELAAMKCLYLVDPITKPDRCRPGTMDHAVEASAERVRDHLRRPFPGPRRLLMETTGNTVNEIDPRLPRRRCLGVVCGRRARKSPRLG